MTQELEKATKDLENAQNTFDRKEKQYKEELEKEQNKNKRDIEQLNQQWDIRSSQNLKTALLELKRKYDEQIVSLDDEISKKDQVIDRKQMRISKLEGSLESTQKDLKETAQKLIETQTLYNNEKMSFLRKVSKLKVELQEYQTIIVTEKQL